MSDAEDQSLLREYLQQENDYFEAAVTPTRVVDGESEGKRRRPARCVMLPPPADPVLAQGRELARATRERDLLLRLLVDELGLEPDLSEERSDLEEGRLVAALAVVEWTTGRADEAERDAEALRSELDDAALERGRIMGRVELAISALENGYRMRALRILLELARPEEAKAMAG